MKSDELESDVHKYMVDLETKVLGEPLEDWLANNFKAVLNAQPQMFRGISIKEFLDQRNAKLCKASEDGLSAFELGMSSYEDELISLFNKVLGVEWRADDYPPVLTTTDGTSPAVEYVYVGSDARLFGDPAVDNLPQVADDVVRLAEIKSGFYKDSWRKRGGVGVYMNIGRKFDRLTNIVEAHSKGFEVEIAEYGESIIDTLLDQANYCMMWVSWMMKTEEGRKAYDAWKRNSFASGQSLVLRNEES